jgi:hypothetical protein
MTNHGLHPVQELRGAIIMITKTLIAAAAVAVLAAGISAPANAKVHVDLFVGGYNPGYNPGYYEPSYPVYDGGYRPRRHHRDNYENYEPAPVYQNYGISCDEGGDQVRESGFYKVRALSCDGKRYTYKGRRDGIKYIIKVSRRSGDIVSVQEAY